MFPIFIKVPWLHVHGITLWFLVLYKGELRDSLRRHETIHYRQYQELWVVGFLALYLADFLTALCRKHGFWKPAYRRIRLEQEAVAHEQNEGYLNERKPHAWKDYKV